MKSGLLTSDELEIELRVVVYREDTFWLAHCLEMDIVAEGDTPRKATKDLIDLCTLQIKVALEDSDLASIFRPAPPETWKMFYTSRKKKPIKPSRSGPITQIDERELELV